MRILAQPPEDVQEAPPVQPATTLAEYRERFLSHPRFQDGRKSVYISPELHWELSILYRDLKGDPSGTFSGFVESILREHIESYRETADRWERSEK